MFFNEMNLIVPLASAVKKSGYVNPTPIQESTIPLVLAGKDILGCAQTGTGKTAAFALPILQLLSKETMSSAKRPGKRSIRSLILAPTRELAIQNFEAFDTFGKSLPLRSAVIYGGVNQARQVEQLNSGVDILVATPGRLNDLIGQGYISLKDIEIFVLDEADRMLDMGFIHDVKKVIALLPKQRQTLLFSATMPPEVESLAVSLLNNPETVKIDPVTSTVDKISQSVYFVEKEDKNDLLLHLLKEGGVYTALVFTRTKHGADMVVKKLLKSRINAMAIHGNKSQNARQDALTKFKNGKISVLVATDIAARGIDIIELPFVINYNIPEEPETYIHRIGRTGRAGLDGRAISMCCPTELVDWKNIVKLIKVDVTEEKCQWSVENMKPQKLVPRTNQPKRSTRDNPGNPRKSADKPSAEAPVQKTDKGTKQKPQKAQKQGNSAVTEKQKGGESTKSNQRKGAGGKSKYAADDNRNKTISGNDSRSAKSKQSVRQSGSSDYSYVPSSGGGVSSKKVSDDFLDEGISLSYTSGSGSAYGRQTTIKKNPVKPHSHHGSGTHSVKDQSFGGYNKGSGKR